MKLWFVLRSFGKEGIANVLRGHLAAAAEIAQEVENHPDFELAAPALFSLICFRYRGTDEQNRELLDALHASGKALLSSTTLNGKLVLRMAIGNIGTNAADVHEVWDWIRGHAAKFH